VGGSRPKAASSDCRVARKGRRRVVKAETAKRGVPCATKKRWVELTTSRIELAIITEIWCAIKGGGKKFTTSAQGASRGILSVGGYVH